ncbi:Ig-like domain-containing protein, partial [Vibrio sp. 10N.261.46.C10]|uniref:Ig-like domain-containing protein n=1 Tax=Vibrio sp. 10N.261.46.C10 TaxID=3229660 RepID=UPI003550A969
TIDTMAENDGGRLATESDSGRTDSDGITNNTAPRFEGKTEAGAFVTVKINGGGQSYTIEAEVDANGDWVADSATSDPSLPKDGLSDGVYTWTVTVTDPAGNTTTSEPQDLTIDTVAENDGGRLATESDSGRTDSDG